MNLPRLVHGARDSEHMTRSLPSDVDGHDDDGAAKFRDTVTVERPVLANRLPGIAEQAEHSITPRVDLEDLRRLVLPGLVSDDEAVSTHCVHVNRPGLGGGDTEFIRASIEHDICPHLAIE